MRIGKYRGHDPFSLTLLIQSRRSLATLTGYAAATLGEPGDISTLCAERHFCLAPT
jgi:hypothetical protein